MARRKSDSIKLHPEYGLNPTMGECILCGKPTGKIALLGGNYKEKAPSKMIVSLEPCKECREKYLSIGVMLVEVDSPTSLQPTGRVMVIRDEAFRQVIDKDVPEDKICLVERGLIGKLEGQASQPANID